MNNPLPDPHKFFKSACYFEASLIIVALLLGWIADINPFATLRFSETAILYGIAGTLPLFILFLALQALEHEAVIRIRRLLMETLGPALHRYSWADFFILAAIAGLAEELLFRGVIQPWIENAWGLNAGLVFSNILFGMVHAVTPLYAILATLVGLYLGLFMDFGGERNLLTPIIIHGLYDFLAFIVIIRAYRVKLQEHNEE